MSDHDDNSHPSVPAGIVLSTMNDDGSRRWLRPRVSPGRFLTARRVVAYALIAVFTLLPIIHIHGQPIVLIDILARRLHLFGFTFYPTDTLLLALLVVGIFLSIFWVTALLGRVWCGWACPQTVYLEFVFRPIERLLQGAPGRAPRGFIQTSGLGSGLKFVVYFIIAFFLAHTFLAFFVSWDRLLTWVIGSPTTHFVGFSVVMIVTGAMLFTSATFVSKSASLRVPMAGSSPSCSIALR